MMQKHLAPAIITFLLTFIPCFPLIVIQTKPLQSGSQINCISWHVVFSGQAFTAAPAFAL
jgi:hypothetical protein